MIRGLHNSLPQMEVRSLLLGLGTQSQMSNFAYKFNSVFAGSVHKNLRVVLKGIPTWDLALDLPLGDETLKVFLKLYGHLNAVIFRYFLLK